jgi:hypothetical protein
MLTISRKEKSTYSNEPVSLSLKSSHISMLDALIISSGAMISACVEQGLVILPIYTEPQSECGSLPFYMSSGYCVNDRFVIPE